MQTILYRTLNKADFPAIRNLINDAFGLHRYLDNPQVLDSGLHAYLQSCLAEATFSCVAQQDGVPIGVIMGKADRDHRAFAHCKSALALGYHTLCMNLKALRAHCDTGDYMRMHQVYHQLRTACPQRFDGVVTLFVITEQCRGLGVGKELLRRLLTYQKEHGVTKLYLYTDTSCNFGFYEHQGFVRLGEQTVPVTKDGEKTEMGVFLYGYSL